jgi:hypothetical protein
MELCFLHPSECFVKEGSIQGIKIGGPNRKRYGPPIGLSLTRQRGTL